jgi:hypothetical protein
MSEQLSKAAAQSFRADLKRAEAHGNRDLADYIQGKFHSWVILRQNDASDITLGGFRVYYC